MFGNLKSVRGWLIALSVAIPATSAQAVSYTWDLTYDGTTLTETTPGSGFAGAILSVGDDFQLTIRAAGDGFWTTTASHFSLPVNPRFASGGGRTTANAVSAGFLDGVQVFRDVESGQSRCCAELGVNNWSLPVGTRFDTVVLNYSLLATTFGDATLSGALWRPTFRGADYTAAAAVPLPASGLLILFALGGLGALRLRKTAA